MRPMKSMNTEPGSVMSRHRLLFVRTHLQMGETIMRMLCLGSSYKN